MSWFNKLIHGALIVLFLIIGVAFGWENFAKDNYRKYQSESYKEKALKREFESKQQMSVRLSAYRQQMQELQDLLKPLRKKMLLFKEQENAHRWCSSFTQKIDVELNCKFVRSKQFEFYYEHVFRFEQSVPIEKLNQLFDLVATDANFRNQLTMLRSFKVKRDKRSFALEISGELVFFFWRDADE